jgi:hypothetical protein
MTNKKHKSTQQHTKKKSEKLRRHNSAAELRQELIQGSIANRELNVEMAAQWCPLEEEAWAYLPE